MQLKIPTRFLIDHQDRALETPDYTLRGRYAFVSSDDANLDSLVSDARWYATLSLEGMDDPCRPFTYAARAMLQAMHKQGYDILAGALESERGRLARLVAK